VEDNGPGVPEEIRPTIFEPYSSTKGRGRGIGLSISRQIALAHGGELRLQPHDSVKGGAGFCLEIPARPIVPDRVAAEVLPPGPRRFVLVSEDDVDVRRLIERTVREIGLAVLWHTSGAEIPASTVEARDTLAAAVIDSCALDLESATVASLRQLSPSLPILLVSASLIDRGRRITRWGMVESLPKPFDSLEFAEALYSALADESLVRWTNAQSDSQPCFHMETQE
jgi:CheY-like chemotaxis protein